MWIPCTIRNLSGLKKTPPMAKAQSLPCAQTIKKQHLSLHGKWACDLPPFPPQNVVTHESINFSPLPLSRKYKNR